MPTTIHRDQRHDDQAAAPTSSAGIRRARTPTTRRDQRRIRTTVLVIAVLLAAIVAAVVFIAPPVPVNVPAAEPRSGVGTLDEDEALRRLIARGYVPAATAETNPDTAVPGDLYTAEEAATLRHVRAGLLPDELLDTELYVTKRLINRGLIPVGSAR